MEKQLLIREVKDNVGTLKFNRPEKGNALSPELLVKIYMSLKEWADNNSVKAVVITGNSDKVFSSGYDILSIPKNLSEEELLLLQDNNPLELAIDGIKSYPYPVIAMINGYCFGAGLNLAICCDIRIGADDIKAGMPPAKLGVVYHPDGLSQFIEVIGMANTREMFLTAKTYKGHEIKGLGIVNYLVPRSDLFDFTYSMAKEISDHAPLALKGTKRILNMLGKTIQLNSEEINEAELLLAQAFNSDDLKEGQTAFFEKRKPVFKGQ